MTRYMRPDSKFLIIGGCIANFDRCCSHVYRFGSKLVEDSSLELKTYSIKIWIRRPGQNYLDGLRKIH